jgi:outer membrane receptor for ferric coprogen and ferric-rhodotorulic acid
METTNLGAFTMSAKFSLLLGGALSILAATPALAQSAGETPDSEAEIVVTGTYTLPDQIDTATGLGLTVRETPQSVSIITSQRILDQNLVSAADVLVNAVGVSINELDDLRNQFYARGFEIKNFQIDGVPIAWTLAGGAGETSTDVSIYERVEVVRGATGLLTGAGDPSASVNFVRKHADSAELKGYVSLGFGSWNTWRVSGDVGTALTADGRIRVRAVGRYEQGKSYIDLYRNKKFVLYGVVDADVTDTTLVRAGISHQEGRPDAPAWGNLPTFFSDGSVAIWPRSKSTTASWAYWNTVNQNIFATVRQEIGEDWSITANYNRMKNAEQAQLLYMSGTVDKTTGIIQFAYPYKDDGTSIQNSFDAQLKGNLNLFGRDHELVLGALRSVQKRHNDGFSALSFPASGPDFVNWDGRAYPNPGFSTVPTRAVEEKVTQTGFYGALRLNLHDRVKLIGGGRLASWKQKGVSYGVASDYGDDNVFIPYVGALFDLTTNHRLYASYTKIFQPQSARDRNLNTLDPLEGNAYEVGVKSAFFNDALQTSIALFRIDQDNLAQPDIMIIPPGGGLPQQTYVAAQGTTSRGFEIEVTGQPLKGWNVNFGYTQFQAEDSSGIDVSVDQPRKLLKLFTTYTVEGVLDGFTFGGGVNYRSKAYSAGANPVTAAPFRFQQDGYALVSLMARLNVNEQLQVQANIENLFDKTYFAQIGFYQQYRYGAPRNFSISANYRF